MRFYLYPGPILLIIILGGKDMFKNKRVITSLISSIVVLIVAALLIWAYNAYTQSKVQEGEKHITIQVINDGVVIKSIDDITTNEEFLRPVMQKYLTYEEGTFNVGTETKHYVTSIQGITPDSTHFWELVVNGTASQVGIDDYAIQDGDTITFEMTQIQDYSGQ